jgi:hypothetical protein
MERRLRQELAEIDDATRRYSIDINNQQFKDDIGFRSAAFDTTTNMDIIRLLMGGL